MTATDLISTNVVVGLAEERLSDVAARISANRSHYCVVLSDDRHCLGTVRLADIAARSNPGNRILGDLVGQIIPLSVRAGDSAEVVASLFVQHSLAEALVLNADDRYVGLITSESVLAWSVRELQLRSNTTLAPQTPATPQLPEARLAPRTPDSLPSRMLLVVEDHADSRKALSIILRRRGYEVLECATVGEALRLASSFRFELVLSDIDLPDGDGLGLMKELTRLYGVKGIAVTGRVPEVHRGLSREAGFSHYLQKPVSLKELDRAILDALSPPPKGISQEQV